MNKSFLILALLNCLAVARADNNPPPPINRPINRPSHPIEMPLPIRQIPVKAEFKNTVMRGYARQLNYDAKSYLTNPKIASSFDPSDLSPINQRLYQAVLSDVVRNHENFNQQNWTNFISGLGTDIANVDIESLVFVILQQAAAAEGADLKTIMDEVKKTNEAKEAMREKLAILQELQTICVRTPALCKTLTAADIAALNDRVKGQLDSMSEMGEEESLRLQMAMDRMSKMMTTLSNVLKKLSDTAQSIVQNMK